MEGKELSLVIQNPEQGQFLKHIDWNQQEFKELVAGIMEQYKNVVFTEDQIKEAKEERARLNAMKKAISDRRIQIKKEVMVPVDRFEAEVKEVVDLIDGPIAEIDKQIKAYEENQKAEKKEALRQHFAEIASDLEGVLSFEQVFDKRYLNVTVTLVKAKRDIADKVDRIRQDLKNVESIEPEYQVIVKDAYLKTFDLGKAFGEMYRLKELKRRDDERKEAAAKEQAEREAAARAATQVKAEKQEAPTPPPAPVPQQPQPTTPQAQTPPPAQDPFTPRPQPKQYKAAFMVYGTKDEIMSVRQFMIDHKIRFGKVEKQ